MIFPGRKFPHVSPYLPRYMDLQALLMIFNTHEPHLPTKIKGLLSRVLCPVNQETFEKLLPSS
jgi:hypothetical protein